MTITINEAQRLYVVPSGDGYTCLGFDVLEERMRKMASWLFMQGFDEYEPTAEPFTPERYAEYRALMDKAGEYCRTTGKQCSVFLTPQLIGCEGVRVKTVDQWGNTERFIVGRSTGWAPIHIMRKRKDSTGGFAAASSYKTVEVL